MNRIILIASIILSTLTIKGQLPSPEIRINKLFFDSFGNWTIELYYKNFSLPLNQTYDSVWIGSNCGMSKLKNIRKPAGSGFIILTKDSLSAIVTINLKCDKLTLGINKSGLVEIQIDSILSQHTNVISLREGQSISYVGDSYTPYCLSKYQRLGVYCDTAGVYGTLKGYIYDKNNNLVTNTKYDFTGLNGTAFPIKLNSNGSFSQKVYSGYFGFMNWNSFFYLINSKNYSCNISPTISFGMVEPDSIIERDIHLTDLLSDGINIVPENSNSLFEIFPNPINANQEINYKISFSINSKNCFIDLIMINGMRICRYQVSLNSGSIKLPANLVTGQYIVELILDSKIIKSKQLIVN
jgi:hypothetical protein